MRKRLLKGYFLIFLALILYLTVIVPFPKTVIFWIAFGFSVPVFLAQVITLHKIVKQDILPKDRALDFPRLRISALYSIIQFAVSLLLMKFAVQIPVWAAAAIEVVVLLIAVVGFYAVEAACAEVLRQHAQTRDNKDSMRDMKERLNRLILHCDQEQVKNRLRKLADEMRYANPASTDSPSEIENEMKLLLTEIEDLSLAEDADTVFSLCDRMDALLQERDRICKDRR